jgi:hypothetical protein
MFYSFIVVASKPVGIPRPLVLLDTGKNVFNAEVDDLETFKKLLENEGVVIKQVNCLNAQEGGSPEDLVLAGVDFLNE